ncbi:hypothetical protein SporoP17a_01785 [Sporosarcina ureae]|nr:MULTISPECIES: DNA alkylation repair protein [Sporosarcina]ARF16143.1 hypothetical protein SporoP17a_01785 [Sporosarcina ureae]
MIIPSLFKNLFIKKNFENTNARNANKHIFWHISHSLQRMYLFLFFLSLYSSVYGFHRIIGDIALKYPVVDKTMMQWCLDENIWLRRIVINHQMFAMNEELLEKILINNLDDDEFFINKAMDGH